MTQGVPLSLALRILSVFLGLCWALASAAPLELTANIDHASLSGRMEHFADASNKLSFEAVQQQRFTPLTEFRSLGYDTDAHWFRFEVSRAADAPRHWILVIGRPYLEEVDVWISSADGNFRHVALGRNHAQDNQTTFDHHHSLPIELDGTTRFYVRVHSTNPIIVSTDLWLPVAFSSKELRGAAHSGLHLGILLIAVALYAILSVWMRDAVMATYACYIVSQALMIHGGTLGFLSSAPWMDDVMTRLGWLGGSISIVLMWDRLLELQRHHRRIHSVFLVTVLFDLLLLPFALMPSKVTEVVLMAVKGVNVLNSANFFISMGLLLKNWWRNRQTTLLLYFVAFLIPALGSLTNTVTNQGGPPLNTLTENIIFIAPLAHILIMSVGLALRLRRIQHDKTTAEQEVAIATQRAEEQRRFVAMLSHEFRNPLAAIDRSAQMIQIKAQHLDPPEAQRLASIRANAATLFGFVDNFLITEALDHGALALSLESCAIRPLVAAAVQAQGEAATERVRLTVTPEDGQFSLDSTLVGVAVGNLVGNALRYSPADTSVEVSARLDKRGLRIRVADWGPGLSEAELDKLGTPYFRASSSVGKKGSGLGYHFTRRIVEAHGGTLTPRAREGRGLEVEIFLPLATA